MGLTVVGFPAEQQEDVIIEQNHHSASIISCLSDVGSLDWFAYPPERDEVFNLAAKNTPLIGRAEELHILSELHSRALNGSSEVCIVYGPSGVGKTALVQAGLRDYMASEDLKGFFAGGKFEPKPGLAYASIVSCFTDLVDLVMQHECVDEIKASIDAALGSEACVLQRLVSNLRFLLDIAEDFPAIDKQSIYFQSQSLNHLKLLCKLFISSVATPVHPVILFFDDAQWADKNSRGLIEALITDPASNNVIVVVAFREEEGEPHELQLDVPASESENGYSRKAICQSPLWPLTEIRVGCLGVDKVNEVVAGLLKRTALETHGLSNAIQTKTSGNVHHVVHYLGSLESRELLIYSPQKRQWSWRIVDDILMDANGEESILALISRRLQEMNEQEIECLRLAAFIGFKFDAELLAQLMLVDGDTCTGDLNADMLNLTAARKRVKSTLKLATKKSLVEQSGKISMYKFSHDSIHEAFYESLNNQLDTTRLHLTLGRILWERLLRGQLRENYASLLMTTEHLNRGKNLISNPDERIALALLNLRTVKLSTLRTAYHTEFLDHAISLVGDADSRWELHHELCLDLFSTASEHSLTCSKHEQGKRLAQEVLKQAHSPQDKVRAYISWISILGTQGFLDEACRVGSIALSELGEPFPKRITQFHALRELGRVSKTLRKMTDEDLRTLPIAEEEKQKGITQIFGALSLYSLYSDEKWMSTYISLRTVHLSLREGLSELTPQSFVMLGAIFARTSGHRKATKFGRLGVNMLQHTHDPAAHVRTAVLFHSMINHWQRPIEESIEPLIRSFELGAKGGDHYFSLSARFASIAIGFYCGHPLVELEEDMGFLGKRAVELNRGPITVLIRSLLQLLQNLLGRSADPLVLAGEAMNEEDMIAENYATQNHLGVRYINFIKLILFVHLGSWNECQGIIQEFLKKEKSSPFSMTWIDTFYCGVASFELHKMTMSRRYQKIGRSTVKKMTAWVNAGAVSCEPLLLILKAEQQSALAKAHPSEVSDLYEEAIVSCRSQNLPHYEALANEKFADFLIEQRRYDDARRHAQQAYRLYRRWQATAKLNFLSAKYGSSISAYSSD